MIETSEIKLDKLSKILITSSSESSWLFIELIEQSILYSILSIYLGSRITVSINVSL